MTALPLRSCPTTLRRHRATRPLAGPAADSGDRRVHGRLDTSIVNVALPDMINVFGVDQAGHRMGVHRLHAGPGRGHAAVGLAGSQVRHPQHVHGRAGHLHHRLGAVRFFVEPQQHDRFPHRAGRGRRTDHARRAGHDDQDGAAQSARRGGRHLRHGDSAGPAIGPTLGGYLVEFVDWRWIFTINIPVGVIAIFLALRGVPNVAPTPTQAFDWWGAAAIATALFALLLATSEAARGAGGRRASSCCCISAPSA